MKQVENIKIGISGVRGIIGETLQPEIVIRFSRAFATLLRKGRVAVGRDSRVSGEFIRRGVFAGLMFSGITPVDAGIVPTPTLQIYVREKKLAGGIIVTASHNPAEWNGLKFVAGNGLFLTPFQSLNLIDIYHQRAYMAPERNEFPPVEEEHEAFAIHQRRVAAVVDTAAIRKRRFSVLVDPGGGVGALYDRPFLTGLGCRVAVLHEKLGARFPRNPEPVAEHLETASKHMRGGDFAVGFAQDADGDRLAVLDETGRPIGEEYTLPLALTAFFHSHPGTARIVVNQSTSRLTEAVARRHGVEVVRAPVGEINVVERMKKIGAPAGGEGNGGVIIADVHHCRDSFTAMALILELLAVSGKTVAQLVAELPPYRMIKRKMPFPMTTASRIVSILREEYPDGDTADGLRVDTPEHWFQVRASNTEPVLRVVAEGAPDTVEPVVQGLEARIAAIARGLTG